MECGISWGRAIKDPRRASPPDLSRHVHHIAPERPSRHLANYRRSMQPDEKPLAHAIVVEYQLGHEEVIPIFRWQLLKSSQYRIALAMGGVFFIAGIIAAAVPGGSVRGGLVAAGIGLMYLAMYGWLLYLTPSRIGKKIAAEGGSRKIEFTDTDVRVSTALSDVTNRWAVYSEATEHGDMYLLKLESGRCTR